MYRVGSPNVPNGLGYNPANASLQLCFSWLLLVVSNKPSYRYFLICLMYSCGHLQRSVHPCGAGGLTMLEVAQSCPRAGSSQAGGLQRLLPCPQHPSPKAFPRHRAGLSRKPGVVLLYLLHRFAFHTRLFSLEKRACNFFKLLQTSKSSFSSFRLCAIIRICPI